MPNILKKKAWITSTVKPVTAQKSLNGKKPFNNLKPESKNKKLSIGNTPLYPQYWLIEIEKINKKEV